jgi:hypothetical protein
VSVNLDALLEGHALLVADLKRRGEAIDDREAKARRIIEACAVERQELDAALLSLAAVERMYRQRFVPDDAAAMPTVAPMANEVQGKPRARIGEQRYRMLYHLRALNVPLPPVNIASVSDLHIQRVRKQMRIDAADGFVTDTGGEMYAITSRGRDLLERFETYRRSRGEALPPLQGPVRDDDEDGADLAEKESGRESGRTHDPFMAVDDR